MFVPLLIKLSCELDLRRGIENGLSAPRSNKDFSTVSTFPSTPANTTYSPSSIEDTDKSSKEDNTKLFL